MLHDILDDDHLQWHSPLISHYTNFWPYYWSWPYYRIWLFTPIVRGVHGTFATGAACQKRTLTPPDTWSCLIWELQMFICWDLGHSIIHFTTNSWLFTWFDFLPKWLLSWIWHYHFMFLSLVWLLTEFDMTEYRFPWDVCNGCSMLARDAYSSRHLVLSHSGTCKCSHVETYLSWTCLVSGLLSFEHPSVLLVLLKTDSTFYSLFYILRWKRHFGISLYCAVCKISLSRKIL